MTEGYGRGQQKGEKRMKAEKNSRAEVRGVREGEKETAGCETAKEPVSVSISWSETTWHV